MSFFSSSSDSIKFKKIPLTTEQKAAQSNILNTMNSGTGITPEQIAGMTPTEQQAQSLLSNYVGNTTQNSSFTNALDKLNGMVNTDYSVLSDPTYQGFNQEAERLRSQGLAQVARQGQKNGFSYAMPTAKAANDYSANIDASILSKFGDLYNAGQDRKLNAINSTMPFVQYQDNTPLRQIAAASTYGALPRTLAQAQNDANYNNSLMNYNASTNAANSLYNKDRYTGYVQAGQPSGLSQIANFAGGAGGQAILGDIFNTPTTTTGGSTGGTVANTGATNAQSMAGLLSLAALFSDERLKLNITDIDNALEKVEQLNGKTYQYTFKPEENRAGLIAQEVEKVLPQAVTERDGYKVVNYEAVIGLLINAVKELNAKISLN